MQILHFAFGIGAFIAPLLATPFLSPTNVAMPENSSIVQGNIPVSPHLHTHLPSLNRSHRTKRYLDSFQDMDGDFNDLLNEIESSHLHKRSVVSKTMKSSNRFISFTNFFSDATNNLGNRIKRFASADENTSVNDFQEVNHPRSKRNSTKKADPIPPDETVNNNSNTTDTEEIGVGNDLQGEQSNTNNQTQDTAVPEPNSNNGTSNIVTTTSTTTTTTEMFVKPVAASDHNRDGGTADGKQIKNHIAKAGESEPKTESSNPAKSTEDQSGDTAETKQEEAVVKDNSTTAIDNDIATVNGSKGNANITADQTNFPNITEKTSANLTGDETNDVTSSTQITSTSTTSSTTTTTTTTTTTATSYTTTTPKPTTSTTKKTSTASTAKSTPAPSSPTEKPATSGNEPVHLPDIPVKTDEPEQSTVDTNNSTEMNTKPPTAVDNFISAVKGMSRIQFAYIIIGVCLLMNAFVSLALYCRDKNKLTDDTEVNRLDHFHGIRICYKGTLILFLALFFFCYVGLEVSYGALVTTFAVKHNNWTKEQGATVAAIFWGSLATGRGIAIFIAKCCGPTVLIIIDLIFMIIGGLLLSFGVQHYDKILWLGTLILGLGMSSVFPAGLSWADKYFKVSGKTTAMFVIGSSVGQMLMPVVFGYFFDNFSAMFLMYATLAVSVLTAIIFVIMQCLAVKMNITVSIKDRNGFLPLEDEENEETMEMDLVHFDRSKPQSWRQDKRAGGEVQYHTLISDLDDD